MTRKGVRIAVGAIRAATLIDDAQRYGLDPEAIGMTNGSGRLGEPTEIGYGVLFFASDASSFCSGQTLYMRSGPDRPESERPSRPAALSTPEDPPRLPLQTSSSK